MQQRTISDFWSELRRPILGLSPMDGVTDAAFREVTARYGRPDVVFTEFTSAEGIRAGAVRLLDDFIYSEGERPVVAQLFGADPQAFFIGAAVAGALGFDGIDINMGCPAKNVTQHGAGAALILDPERAQAIVRQAKAGISGWANGLELSELGLPEELTATIFQRRSEHAEPERLELPISVKTRLGYDRPIVEAWIPKLLEVSPVAITLHGRTLKQGYAGLADWQAIKRAAAIVHAHSDAVFLGNGDLESRQDALERIEQAGADGALLGRAANGNPWVFSGEAPDPRTRLDVALEHARIFNARTGGRGFVRMRKHLHDYVRGPEFSRELRAALMRADNLREVETLLR